MFMGAPWPSCHSRESVAAEYFQLLLHLPCRSRACFVIWIGVCLRGNLLRVDLLIFLVVVVVVLFFVLVLVHFFVVVVVFAVS